MNDEVLGTLSGEPRDDQAALQAEDHSPLLSPDVVVFFRQSGGLRFSTLEVTVYRDGRAMWQRTGKITAGQGERQLTAEEIAALQDLITQSGFIGLPTPIGRQSPDGYAYEVIAQIADRSASLEFFDNSIPAEVRPLLAHLKALMSADQV